MKTEQHVQPADPSTSPEVQRAPWEAPKLAKLDAESAETSPGAAVEDDTNS